MTKKLLLIDAYAMIYRAYYAFIRAPRMNSRGENTSAIFGFCITLDEILKKTRPTHLAVAFDPKGGTFRHEAYPLYKAQREETPEDIKKAVPIIHRLLHAMRIQDIEVPGFEADDVIGTLAKQAETKGFEVLMATPDKDYAQLVSNHIKMYRPRHNGGFETMGIEEVCTKYGLQNQSQVIDLLALMGDASDNIPGCVGVGEKTAVKLLNEYGSIEQILEHMQEIKGALGQKIRQQEQQIRFSKFLATIRTDVPITLNEDELLMKGANDDELDELYRELEFTSLLKRRTPVTMPESTIVQAQSPQPKPKTTKSAKPVQATLDLFSTIEQHEPASQTTQDDDIKARLCAYLLNPEVPYNPTIEPDWQKLQTDTALWNLYNEVELPLVEVLREMEQNGVRVDTNKLKEAENQLTEEQNAIEKSVIDQLSQMLTQNGLTPPQTLNLNSPAQLGEVLFAQLQLDPKAKKGKNGKYSTAEEVLTTLAEATTNNQAKKVLKDILDYRELKKLISTYISALPSYINPATGKIHTTYNQTVTATGRLSSSNPNLQNLPIRSERGKLIRQAVIADDGCKIISADYSQIELRLMAHFSRDEHMLDAFRQGLDIHTATAAKIFRKPISEVTKDERRRAKTANFGIIYGISAFGLAQQLGCSRTEAKKLIDDYFTAFPKVISFIEAQKDFARQHGYVETLFGRKRFLPDISSHNATVRSFAERNAVNAPIQGTAADIIKIAMVSIHRILKARNLKAQMIMQVHDELNFNVPLSEIDEVKQIVVHEMQNVVHLTVPLIAECGVGENWLQAH